MDSLKFVGRQLLKNPGFTAVAVLTLTVNVGTDTASLKEVHRVIPNL